MDQYEERLKKWMSANGVAGEHLSFQQSCHSVQEAAAASNARMDEFVKNVCMVDSKERLIVVIVKGEDRASTERVGKALNVQRPRLATPEEILQRTGFPCGGTPSFGYDAVFLIDQRVLEKEVVYTGGGSENSLVRIASAELVRVNKGQVVRVRK